MLWPLAVRRRSARGLPDGSIDLRWLTARSWSSRWYPQGIDLGRFRGRRTLAVSWFHQDRSRRHLASRVSLIDLGRSRHVDVFLAVPEADGTLQPARIHAGGLAWFGDRLLVAATREGVWEFDLADVRTVRGPAARTVTAATRRRALVVVRTRVHAVDLRCSFLGRVVDDTGAPCPRVLVGEYRTDVRGRIGEFELPPDAEGELTPTGTFRPGIPRMQGAVRWGTRHLVSQSDGVGPGSLWSGAADDLRRTDVSLPAGCEDLALDPDAGLLWSLGEHPWRRVVRGIPLHSLGIAHRRRT